MGIGTRQKVQRKKNSALSSLTVEEKHQIMKYYFYFLGLLIKRITEHFSQGCQESSTLILCWWKCKGILPLWMAFWQYLLKFKWIYILTHQLHFEIYSTDTLIYAWEDVSTKMVVAKMWAKAKTRNNLNNYQWGLVREIVAYSHKEILWKRVNLNP